MQCVTLCVPRWEIVNVPPGSTTILLEFSVEIKCVSCDKYPNNEKNQYKEICIFIFTIVNMISLLALDAGGITIHVAAKAVTANVARIPEKANQNLDFCHNR